MTGLSMRVAGGGMSTFQASFEAEKMDMATHCRARLVGGQAESSALVQQPWIQPNP